MFVRAPAHDGPRQRRRNPIASAAEIAGDTSAERRSRRSAGVGTRRVGGRSDMASVSTGSDARTSMCALAWRRLRRASTSIIGSVAGETHRTSSSSLHCMRSPCPSRSLKIAGGTVYDPASGVAGEVRDLWIAGGKFVAPPADAERAAGAHDRRPRPGRDARRRRHALPHRRRRGQCGAADHARAAPRRGERRRRARSARAAARSASCPARSSPATSTRASATRPRSTPPSRRWRRGTPTTNWPTRRASTRACSCWWATTTTRCGASSAATASSCGCSSRGCWAPRGRTRRRS